MTGWFRVLLVVVLSASAWAKGVVLPFSGPGGHSIAQAVAGGLGVAPPSLAAILLPDMPWQGSYDLAAGSLSTAGGARLAREISGATWLLVGAIDRQGWVRVFLADERGIRKARFSRPELAMYWTAAQVGVKAGGWKLEPVRENDLARLSQGDLGVQGSPLPIPYYRAAVALRDDGVASLLITEQLPRDLHDFWNRVRQNQPPLAYQALVDFSERRRVEALSAARKLAEGKVYERLTALLLFRGLEDPQWAALARNLTETAPEMPLAWEELSFAAFDENKAELAKTALERAAALLAEKNLYWTNLGWAHYLLGDYARSVSASLRSLKLEAQVREEYAVPAYNLGLVRALYGDHLGAREAYNLALRVDEGQEFQAALKDLQEAGQPRLEFWKGYLAERAGLNERARSHYQRFVQNNPQSPLVAWAQRAVAQMQQAKVEVSLERLMLRADDLEARPFGAGEAVFPQVRIEGFPYLASGTLVTRLLDAQGQVLQSANKAVAARPLTTGIVQTGAAVRLPREGTYTLEVLYGSAKARLELTAGKPSLTRQLYTAGIVLRNLSNAPLLSGAQMLSPEGEALAIQQVQAALHEVAPRAQQIPNLSRKLTSGPYSGNSIAELLQKADEALVRAFLEAVVGQPDLIGDGDVVNGFIGWLSPAPR
ncbi:tetratricopeptide repeat protein [Meiothermus cerbereus]|uniref:tetratricopeptide repeat protein n=1 Tax=Meiothermus cerbereus TaxID=65552 RepID=UPI00048687A8|nr:tetratricopeptide repeat protein [Meiothermus cerbereus]